MLFTNIDRWVGKTLFVPPIIKLCQITHQSQFAVARLFWFIAALDGFCRADTLFSSLLWGGISIVMMFTAARRADQPTVSFMPFRLLGLVLLIVSFIETATTGQWADPEFWVFVLIAEYAATIRVVPPKSRSKKVVRSSSNV